jgi:hypothetical protein
VSPLADAALAKKLDFDAPLTEEASDDHETAGNDYEASYNYEAASNDYEASSDEDKENQINKAQPKPRRRVPAKKSKKDADKYVVEELQSPPNKTPGARRSRRRRMQPLEYWKNERVVYGRRESC